ncbi:polysaccharide pyruvyl transferase family protein [Paraburkholderia phenazinium]|uniref:Polysaccharide pyruvyl transferase family protein WcaK n=1 Tax=Paraburkholderia phenazinium TaxID=60549 RepID=A0A1G7QCE1_9BURK|nr:polysaccharide pyruvyl transferase family protein [Paraburkholderia phenazinium]SDF96154.1 Polysaccharide pyruvyl transferase family protein WcaK [Paraburkholderia phenazinium]
MNHAYLPHPPSWARESHAPSVALVNVKYSPNLGDGLLSECLEAELLSVLPEIEIHVIDLAGRTRYDPGTRSRKPVLTLMHHSPRVVRHAIAQSLLGSKLRIHLRPHWRAALHGIDAVIVGGGNLLSDADLNFPLKLDAVMAEVRSLGLPTAVFGVGVSDNWTPRGEALFRRAFGGPGLFHASVRESRSAGIWQQRLSPAGIRPAQVVHDPGHLVSLHVARSRAPDGMGAYVGLGLTHPIALKYHGGTRHVSAAAQARWYSALVRAGCVRGWRFVVFANGSPEDEAYLSELRPALAAAGGPGQVTFAPRAATPADLARLISSFDLLMAHRLHANITAFSYGIPQIGFAWDVKLETFLAQVGRRHCLCRVGADQVESVIDLAVRQLGEGVDARMRRTVLDEARAHVADLATALTTAVSASQRAADAAPVAVEARS